MKRVLAPTLAAIVALVAASAAFAHARISPSVAVANLCLRVLPLARRLGRHRKGLR